jgi:hypothetical protein
MKPTMTVRLMMFFNWSIFRMYFRKPVKNAPAPRAMTAKSKVIHRPNPK